MYRVWGLRLWFKGLERKGAYKALMASRVQGFRILGV